MRLSDELARVLPERRRRAREDSPNEVVPAVASADPFDAARDRLRAEIAPPSDDAE